MKATKSDAFTLIELLVVISIIAILAGIALPVFGEVQIRGAQTKALSNGKQVGTACKLFAMDYQGSFPQWSKGPDGTPDKSTSGSVQDSNAVLETLVPDYLPDKGVFAIPKSAYCKLSGAAGAQDKLVGGENEWAYVTNLSDTSNSRFPLIADGFTNPAGSEPSYNADETKPGGVWKAKKAVVIRCDISGTVETLYGKGTGTSRVGTVKRFEDKPTENAFVYDQSSDWLNDKAKVLNPIVP
jgi:prepilin-type N-terminal cleavage/methylation domain-containing protein